MEKLCLIAVFLFSLKSLTDGLSVYVEPQMILLELGAGDANCTASNYQGTIDYMWFKNNDPSFRQNSRILELSQVTISDAGIYRCEVREIDTGKKASDTMELIIHYAPRWNVDFPQKAAGYTGAPTDIKCYVASLPVASFYWMKNDLNLTNGPEYSITSEGNVSTLRIHSVNSSQYGSFVCSASNYVGGRNFYIPFSKPSIPDSPDDCFAINITARNATLECKKGFDGGEPATLTFIIFKSHAYQDAIETDSSFTWVSNTIAHITVLELEPILNYTLMVYQENKYGKSSTSFGVLINTPDGSPLPSKINVELAIIIGGAVGGALVLTALIIIIYCSCRKARQSKPREPSSPGLSLTASTAQPTKKTSSSHSKKKDVSSYVMENDYNEHTPNRDQSRSSMREIGSSFRMRKQPRAVAGINNPNYQSDGTQGQSSHRVVLDYTGDQNRPEANNSAYFVNIKHDPGESSEGVYENTAYLRDSRSNLNTTLSSSITSAHVAQRQLSTDPKRRAQLQCHDQPGLAGFGALKDFNMDRLADAPISTLPLIPIIEKEVRLSVRTPGFEPEVPWEFPRERLFVRMKVGEGTFGEVWRAKADGILGRSGRMAVAVKMLKVHYTPEERRALIKELEIMKLLQPHPNIIHLLGCCTTSEPTCIIMEYAEYGNLQDLLRKQRSAFNLNDLSRDSPNSNQAQHVNLKLNDLKRFGLHIASGMEYIASRELLHRDLAARNILVDENLICKVGDFGSARDVMQLRQYESKTQRRLPIRWMAPESLYQCVYTVHSDVWSFGILLWEIITLASSPYPGMGGPEVMKFIQNGNRMSKPKHCSDALYAVMKDCWNATPPKRPSFNILRHRMIAVLDEPGDDIYVEQMYDNAYEIVENLPGEKC